MALLCTINKYKFISIIPILTLHKIILLIYNFKKKYIKRKKNTIWYFFADFFVINFYLVNGSVILFTKAFGLSAESLLNTTLSGVSPSGTSGI